jgi:hypothetical protein
MTTRGLSYRWQCKNSIPVCFFKQRAFRHGNRDYSTGTPVKSSLNFFSLFFFLCHPCRSCFLLQLLSRSSRTDDRCFRLRLLSPLLSSPFPGYVSPPLESTFQFDGSNRVRCKQNHLAKKKGALKLFPLLYGDASFFCSRRPFPGAAELFPVFILACRRAAGVRLPCPGGARITAAAGAMVAARL